MRVNYQYTEKDLPALQRAVPLNVRAQGMLRFVLGLAFVTLPGTLPMLVRGDWTALATAWVLQAVLLGWMYLGARKARTTPDPKTFRPTTLSLDEQGVTCETAIGWGKRDWTLIKKIDENAAFVLLFVSEREAFAVPRRAFASDSERGAFVAEARRCLARSREPGYSPFTPPTPAEAIAGPFPGIATLLQVQYENSAEEVREVEVGGLGEPKKFWRNLRNYSWLFVLALVMFGLLFFQRSDSDSWDRIVGLVMHFFMLELALVLLLQIALARLSPRHIEPYRLAPQSISISAAGVFGSAPRFEHQHTWAAFDEIAENNQSIVLYLTKPAFLAVIPNRAFSDACAAAEFVQLARHWKAASLHFADELNAAPRVETGNPYQSPDET